MIRSPDTATSAAIASTRRPDPSLVTVRDLGTNGTPTPRTTFRLSHEYRDRLRRLASRTFGGISMSAVLRILIDRAWAAHDLPEPAPRTWYQRDGWWLAVPAEEAIDRVRTVARSRSTKPGAWIVVPIAVLRTLLDREREHERNRKRRV